MAIVQVVHDPKEQKESILDKVLKGVSLANNILEVREKAVTYGDRKKLASLSVANAEAENKSKYSPQALARAATRQGLEDEKLKAETTAANAKAIVNPLDGQKTQAEIKKIEAETRKALAEAGKAGRESNSQDEQWKAIIPESRKQIESLASKNGEKASIVSQIDSTLEFLKDPKNSEEQKKVIGGQLIKTLNSSEGKDAVGAEEVARLAPFLSPQGLKAIIGPGNMFSSNMPAFIDQVANTSNAIKGAIGSNQKQIESLRSGRGLDLAPVKGNEPVKLASENKKAPAGPPKFKVGNKVIEGDPDNILAQIEAFESGENPKGLADLFKPKAPVKSR